MKFLLSLVVLGMALTVASAQADTNEVARKNIFTRRGIVYNQAVDYQCDYTEQQQAIDLAVQAATSDCYEAGFNSCRVNYAHIYANGITMDQCADLGQCNGGQIVLYWGCKAKAIVKGS